MSFKTVLTVLAGLPKNTLSHRWKVEKLITSAKEVMLSLESVCLSVNRITQKLLIKS